MSSILSSQGVVLATAMAVSGILFLAFSRQQKTFLSLEFPDDPNNPRPPQQILRSCLSTDEKKKKKKKKKKKRVQFAENVKEPSGNGKEFRKEQRKKFAGVPTACRNDIPGIPKMPENQAALYHGILRDRVHRTACSY